MRKRTTHCSICGSLKIILRNGASRCKACANRRQKQYYAQDQTRRLNALQHHLTRRYGLVLQQLELLLIKQGGRCAVCLRYWQDCPRSKGSSYGTSFVQHLNVDHDHRTDRVRGLLCNGCNAAIGNFNDDSNRVYAALDYLTKHKGTVANVDLP